MPKILCVDDSAEILEAVVGALEPIGVTVVTAGSVEEALSKAIKQVFDLVIIDIGLPDGDGFELFVKMKGIEGFARVPVIFLTSKEDVASKVSAFSLGVDDYLVKPFHFLELRARVENRIQKYLSDRPNGDQVLAGPFVLDVGSQRLKVRGESGVLSLTPKEFKILLLLTRYPDQIFTREQILDKILGSDVHVIDRTVDAHVCYLRKKLGRFSSFIEAVSGVGYRFNPSQTPKVASKEKGQWANP